MRYLFFTIAVLFTSIQIKAQSSLDIVGMWQNEEENQRIEIYQGEDSLFYAKLVWLPDSISPYNQHIFDIENKETTLRERPLIGIDVLHGFEYFQEKEFWKNGEIYNFKNGNSYNGKIILKEEQLHLTGFYGILFFLGKTQKWDRYEQ